MKLKIIKVPVYKRRFTLCTNREQAVEILRKYQSNFSKDETLEYAEGICYFLDIKGCYLIGVFNNTLSVLNHELGHLATRCLNNGDTYDLRKDDENFCYLLEALTEIVYKELGIKNSIK